MKKGRPATLLKNRLWRRCFHVNSVKFLRTPALQNTSGRLLLFFHNICMIQYSQFDRMKHFHLLSFIMQMI